MFVIIWRYNSRGEWYLHNRPVASRQDALSEINNMARYDVAGRREYRWCEIGEAESWHDPYAEQAAREAEGGI